ncbi:DDE-type integrase/transposase/recombinase [Faecalicatena contorta]|uniref:DDE-type integrase/transposase/recombinase n=1 Tax=Faecalicatena contorta TaxID=39482 RepID=UPI002FE65F1E
MNLSKRMQQAKVCPYFLRNAVIDVPNQAWSIDITYIPIRHGFLYLTAVIDWHSRCIVGWEVDDTLCIPEWLLMPLKRHSRLLNHRFSILIKAVSLRVSSILIS